MKETHDNVHVESTVAKNGTGQYVEITVKFLVPSTKKVKAKRAVRHITEAINEAASSIKVSATKKSASNVCVYCGEEVEQIEGRGRPKKFCSNSCRQKDYKAKRKAE